MRSFLVFLTLLSLSPTAQAAGSVRCCDGSGGKVGAVSADSKIVWQKHGKSPQDGCRLPNRNHLSRQVSGTLESTSDKQGGLQVADHSQFKNINQIMLLDVPGDVTKGEILR